MRQTRAGGVGMLILATTIREASAQTLGGAPDDGISIWRVIAALAVCMVIGLAAILILRMRSGRQTPLLAVSAWARKERRLKLVEVLRVNQHVDLCIVECDGMSILLAASQNGVDELSWPRGVSAEAAKFPATAE